VYTFVSSLRVGFDGLANGTVKLLEVSLGTTCAGRHKVNDEKGGLVDNLLELAQNTCNNAGDGGLGEKAVLADDNVQKSLVNPDELCRET
jgi:hypothetical protein